MAGAIFAHNDCRAQPHQPCSLCRPQSQFGSLPSTFIVGTSPLRINNHILSLPSGFLLLATAIYLDPRSLPAPLRVPRTPLNRAAWGIKLLVFFKASFSGNVLMFKSSCRQRNCQHPLLFLASSILERSQPHMLFCSTNLSGICTVPFQSRWVRFNSRPEQYACRQRSRLRPGRSRAMASRGQVKAWFLGGPHAHFHPTLSPSSKVQNNPHPPTPSDGCLPPAMWQPYRLASQILSAE